MIKRSLFVCALLFAPTTWAALAFDACTAGYEGDFDGTITVSHTPVGTPRGVVAFVFSTATGSHHATATGTYGGTSMSREEAADKSSSFQMGGSVYFLGASVPTGAQNFVFTGSGFGRDHAVVCTFTAAADVEVVASTVGVNGDSVSTHTYTLAMGGTSGYIMSGAVIDTGAVADIGPLTSWGSDVSEEADHGSAVSGVYSRDSQSSGNVTAGIDRTGTDETIGISIGIAEIASSGAVIPVLHHQLRNQ